MSPEQVANLLRLLADLYGQVSAQQAEIARLIAELDTRPAPA